MILVLSFSFPLPLSVFLYIHICSFLTYIFLIYINILLIESHYYLGIMQEIAKKVFYFVFLNNSYDNNNALNNNI